LLHLGHFLGQRIENRLTWLEFFLSGIYTFIQNLFQVPPTEIETCILKLDAIEDVGVVGVPDEEAGELPRAYVVRKKGYDNLTETDILKHVAGKSLFSFRELDF